MGAYGAYVNSDAREAQKLGLLGAEWNWDSWLGPVSQGLGLASEFLGSLSSFGTAGKYRASAGQYRRMGRQALQQGFETAMDLQHQGEETKGTMLSAFGKSGTLLEGSPLLALLDATREIELDKARVIQRARIEAQSYQYQARLAEKAARSATWGGIAGIAGGVGTFLGGL